MADWGMWLVGAGLLVVLEMFTGTFYLLMLAVGFAAGALAALTGLAMAWQLLAAALVGALGTLGLRRSRFGKRSKVAASRNPDINLDIGQQVAVPEWEPSADGGHARARVMYRGALWDVEYATQGLPQPGRFTIIEVRGSRLIVGGASSDNNHKEV